MSKSNKQKNTFLLTIIAFVIIGGMAAFGYQMYIHNSSTVEQISSIDIPDKQGTTGKWIKNNGTNICPLFVEQRFDENKSHYICVYQR